jgi:hypothetical protein
VLLSALHDHKMHHNSICQTISLLQLQLIAFMINEIEETSRIS